MKPIVIVTIAAVLAPIISQTATGSERIWCIESVPTPYGAMALRNGDWPVVAGYAGTYAMTPGGYTKMDSFAGYGIATGPNGEIAVIGSMGKAGSYPLCVRLLKNNRWTTLPSITRYGNEILPDVDIDSKGNVRVAMSVYRKGVGCAVYNGSGWAVQITGQRYNQGYGNIVIDDYDNISIVTSAEVASQNPTNKNQWVVSLLPGSGTLLDTAVSSSGNIGIVRTTSSTLSYLTYDAQSQSWLSNVLANGSGVWGAVAFDKLGNPGVAYTTSGGDMMYAYNSGSGWAESYIGKASSLDWIRVSLAFDSQNNPVAAFGGVEGTIVAYDPIVVPEPVCAGLLIAGLFGLTRKSGERRE